MLPISAGSNASGAARCGRFTGICTVGGMPPEHPLAALITAVAACRFPAADGSWMRVPPWHPGLEAVIAFTGHAVFAVEPDISGGLLTALGADGFGGAHDPRLITALAGPDGWIDSLDILMAARGTGRPGVPPAMVSLAETWPAIPERHSRPASAPARRSLATRIPVVQPWPSSARESPD